MKVSRIYNLGKLFCNKYFKFINFFLVLFIYYNNYILKVILGIINVKYFLLKL